MRKMGWRIKGRDGKRAQGFLQRLRRDVRGNTIALMAAAIIPMIGLLGGALDMSRIYLTKTRLQQACDAGALAGRKVMGGGTWAANNNAALTAANQFFVGNFKDGSYGTTALSYSFTENAGKVSGVASATVPMTLMKVFSIADKPLTVNCDAEMRLPNTDVMFVLDTTGSMNDTLPSDTKTKIQGLRSAVKCFYEVLARIDTPETCGTGGAPSGGTGSQVQIRFGFVPYSENVNVGRLLKPEWMVDKWTYQTRTFASTDWDDWNEYDTTSTNRSGNCDAAPADTSTTQYRVQKINPRWGSDYCSLQKRGQITTWHYGALEQTVSGLKNGSGWNSSFTLPIGDNNTNKTINWDGCIEERQTTRATTYDPIPAAAKDLDIDLVPTSDNTTKWKPALPDLVYTRKRTSSSSSRDLTDDWSTAAIDSTANYRNSSGYACPTAARKLQSYPDSTSFVSYVDSLTPAGNTYHDIGILWGARLMSPGDASGNGGLFASENRLTPQGGEIQRHMIFMTDGDTNTAVSDYNAYGIPWFDKRQVNSTSSTDTDNQVDARFAALCTAVKNKNITLWVISFGSVASDTVTRLTNCASSGRYYSANNSAELYTTFNTIANQISQLRLTR